VKRRFQFRLRGAAPPLRNLTRYNASVLTLRRYQPPDFQRLLEIDQSCFVEGIAY